MKDSILGALSVVQLLSAIFVFALGIGLLAIVVMYIVDVNQTQHAIRRNFPVIGRFRYLFEKLGEYFRQYFFSQDREEMPFNRAQRSWVYRAAKNEDNTVAFGSTRDLRPVGTVIFVYCPYPVLDTDIAPTSALQIGPYARRPYVTDSIFNVSAMSFGS
ncbi:MAG: FMN-binding glutamate synthase family protein, partial [Woeseiaceae bacterium]